MITIFIHDQLWKSIVNETFHKISCMNSVDHEVMISGLKKKRSYEHWTAMNLFNLSLIWWKSWILQWVHSYERLLIIDDQHWSLIISWPLWPVQKLAKIDTNFSFIKPTKQEILHFVTPIWPIFCKQQNCNFFRKQMLPKSWSILRKGWMGPQ